MIWIAATILLLMPMPEQTKNRLKVLKAIRRHGPLARTDLPTMTGLSGGLISRLTAELVKRGLITEVKEQAVRSGRPRTNLRIDSGNRVVLGASFKSLRRLSIDFVDLAGKLLFSASHNMEDSPTLEDHARSVAAAIAEAIAQSPFAPGDILHVGIALPAVVDRTRGIVHYMTTMPHGPVNTAAIIADALGGPPVTIENEVCSMARAEHWFGRASSLETFTLIAMQYSLGSARYVDGLPLVGTNGISAETGHMKLETGPDAPACYCGARGCVNAYASMFGILRADGALHGDMIDWASTMDERFGKLLDRAINGEARARALLATAGEKLGIQIANHICATDPGDILVLLPDARMCAFALPHMQASLAANVMPGMLNNTRVAFDVIDDDWRWKATAALALEQVYLGNGNGRAGPKRAKRTAKAAAA